MNIEEFYEVDERRRDSQEIELGNEWHDEAGHRFDLSYVVDTGELYLMAAPDAEAVEDGFGDIKVDDHEPIGALTVTIVAVIETLDEVHTVLDGWQDEMGKPASTTWLAARLAPFARS